MNIIIIFYYLAIEIIRMNNIITLIILHINISHMNQIESQSLIDSPSLLTEMIDGLPSSQCEHALEILNTLVNVIKKPHPIYKFEIAPTGYKCTGNFLGTVTYCIALTKRDAKCKLRNYIIIL